MNSKSNSESNKKLLFTLVIRMTFILCFLCLTVALPAWGRKEQKADTSEPQTNDLELVYQLPDFMNEGTTREDRSEDRIEDRIYEEKGEIVQVTGIVRLVGNSPFTEIVITGQEKEWYIFREEDALLRDLQHQTVIVEGEETVRELRFANGLSAGERRTLRDIKIISVE